MKVQTSGMMRRRRDITVFFLFRTEFSGLSANWNYTEIQRIGPIRSVLFLDGEVLLIGIYRSAFRADVESSPSNFQEANRLRWLGAARLHRFSQKHKDE